MTLLLDIAAIRLADVEETPIVEGVAFGLADGAALGIVGESGSGKSVLALSIIGLLPPVMRAEGRIELDGI
jgi:ABC-type glutathione transport system ATPase component